VEKILCDNCGNVISSIDDIVKLSGVCNLDEYGILLPERFHKKDFCDSACFWDWASKCLLDYRINNGTDLGT
jgi:hypothetical protein